MITCWGSIFYKKIKKSFSVIFFIDTSPKAKHLLAYFFVKINLENFSTTFFKNIIDVKLFIIGRVYPNYMIK